MPQIATLDKILFSQDVILQKIKDYADFLNKHYQNKRLLVVAILNGAVFFTVHLLPHLSMPVEVDFIAVSSYLGTEKKFETKFYKELKINVKNCNLLILEDIVDSGHTLNMVYHFLKSLKPKTIRACSLVLALRSQQKRKLSQFPIDALLHLQGNYWIVGFGIDYKEQFRNLRDIYSIRWLEYKKPIKIK